ncbi:S1 RNA-binding domain-containing protein [Nocardia suismassiliense]|uniref:S1 RNA-binding domain-containing protein n=1 Tax=Nocardia suismassiliense TaxID=2077092 RepID=UPI0018FE5D2E|nr:S1 RNA-binding domain-containing protein [Nocardia suismassiliense]
MSPELWGFLGSLERGEILSGTVTAIKSFGVFVALDDGPEHPLFPGVGFITIPELSWRWGAAASDVVEVGQRVSGEFLEFDTWNAEARLSLRALQPDPFQAFAEGVAVGEELHGRVTMLVPFGVFVEVSEGIEGLVHLRDLTSTPGAAPDDGVQVGDDVVVVVTRIDRDRRRLYLAQSDSGPDILAEQGTRHTCIERSLKMTVSNRTSPANHPPDHAERPFTVKYWPC